MRRCRDNVDIENGVQFVELVWLFHLMKQQKQKRKVNRTGKLTNLAISGLMRLEKTAIAIGFIVYGFSNVAAAHGQSFVSIYALFGPHWMEDLGNC